MNFDGWKGIKKLIRHTKEKRTVIYKPKMGEKSVEEKYAHNLESSSPPTDSNRQQLSKELITTELWLKVSIVWTNQYSISFGSNRIDDSLFLQDLILCCDLFNSLFGVGMFCYNFKLGNTQELGTENKE
jgi:hypothetical protein